MCWSINENKWIYLQRAEEAPSGIQAMINSFIAEKLFENSEKSPIQWKLQTLSRMGAQRVCNFTPRQQELIE